MHLIDNQQELRTAMGELDPVLRAKVSDRFEQALHGNGANERELNLSGLMLTADELEQLTPLISRYRISRLYLGDNPPEQLHDGFGQLPDLAELGLR